MEYEEPKSECLICKSSFAKKYLTRHIKSCLAKNHKNILQSDSQKLVYLVVSTAYNSPFFLHILIPENKNLNFLDTFLRHIWLECCGHLSAFNYPQSRRDITMKEKIGNVFHTYESIDYTYDFGSSTDLNIKYIDSYYGTMKKKESVQIIARNAEPIMPCDECGEYKAVQICTECSWDGIGWLCEKCTEKHECDEDMLLPVVNSPRAGVCAYTGY